MFIPVAVPQDFQSGQPELFAQTKAWADPEVNEEAPMTDNGTFHADSPSVAGGVERWADYFKGTRLLLVSRDEQLRAIYHDASLTQAQKYEQSKALFENTNRIEMSLNPAHRLRWVRA